MTTVTTETFEPASISVTPAARVHLRKQLDREAAAALVLGVTESGCNGFMYELRYVGADDALADARAFDFEDGVRVYVEQDSWLMVQGTEIDFVTEGLNSALKFNNPNAETQCGCGESFSLRGT